MSKPVFDVNLRTVLDQWDQRRARSRQRLPGASDLGGCRRRVAYKLTGQPVDNPYGKEKAINGTLLHRGVLAALRTAHGGYVEVKVERPGVLRGALDWLRFDPLGLPIVDDLKTTGKDTHDGKVRGPLAKDHAFQIMVYADLLRNGELGEKETRLPREPVEVVDIEVLYLCRDDGRADSRRVPFQQDVADEAWAWLAEVNDRVRVDGANMVPRDHSGPESSAICRGCPFVRACWKWNPEDNTREPLELNDTELDQWAQEYKAAALVESAAKADKDRARAHLAGQPAQKFPSGYELRWSGGQPKWVQEVDVEAIVETYELAGVDVPMRAVDKGRAAAISVVAPKPGKGSK